MMIKKIGAGFKGLFLLAILLAISSLVAVIGKLAFNKSAGSLVAQSGLINTASADVPGGDSPGGEGVGCACSDGGCASAGEGAGGGESAGCDAVCA